MYDLAIIGGGPAGYTAALEAIKAGMSVVMFEKDKVGGTCLNRGCVPTKFLSHTADIFNETRNSNKYGIQAHEVSIDFIQTHQQMDAVIGELRENLEESLGNLTVYGDAHICDNHTILCNREKYETNNLLIATGSSPTDFVNNGSGSSTDLLNLNYIPKTLKIIGGGVIAVEFAEIYNKLGSEVTIAIRGDRILRKWDKEIAVAVTQSFKKCGIKIHTQCKDFTEGSYDFVLSALGRKPNTEGVEKLGLNLDDKSAIITDDLGRTNIDNVYAAGDVTSGSQMLAHVAMEQGRQIVRGLAGEKVAKPSVVANCIYLTPEIASVGMTEKEANENGIDVVIGKQNLRSNARTLIETNVRCFIKVVAEKGNHKIIGAQLVCERATDIASEFVVAINNGLTIEDMLASTHPHPSFSEAITDVMLMMEQKANAV